MQLGRAWIRVALVAMVASVVLPVVVAAVWPAAALTFAYLDHGLSVVAAAVVMVIAGLRGGRRMRRSRLCFAGALAATACGFGLNAWFTGRGTPLPTPSVQDAVTLMWVPLTAVGLLSLPLRSAERGTRLRSALDGVIASAAMFLASWLVVLQPVYEQTDASGLARATLLTYPIVDVVVAVTALSVTCHASAEVRRLLRFIAAGLFLVALSDSGSALHVAQGNIGFSWTSVTLQAGIGLLVIGAVLPLESPDSEPRKSDVVVDATLPYVPVLIAVVAGLHFTLTGGTIALGESILAAIMITGLIWRQVLYSLQIGSLAHSLEVDASHDGLTGLPNRSAFIRELGARLTDAEPGTLAVVMLDLNGFKEINDGYGHSAGDEALTVFAQRLREVADGATAARLGGDEFALMVQGPDAQATAVACAGAVSSGRPVRIGALEVPLTGSAGITVNRVGDAASELLRRADLAMYEAKRSPLSLTAVFSEDMAGRADRRNLLAQALPGAAARGEMHVVYQPLYRLDDSTVAGAEALLRWSSPRHGAVPPDEFIALAEDIGVIRELGAWVLETALRQLSHWQLSGVVVPRLFVNASSRQFTDDFAEQVVEKVDRHGLRRDVLTLEVTESSVPDLEANRALVTLRDAGVRIAMDDFGAGFSSLAQLARLPVDTLKIDREFVRGIDTPNGRRILESVIALANDLGLTTVAEGIELPGQADVVRDAGCTLAQGYHFARPMPAREIAALLPRAGSIPTPRATADRDGARQTP